MADAQERRSGKRQYTLVDFDEECLTGTAPRGVFSVTGDHDDAASEAAPKLLPRVRRLRIGVQIAAAPALVTPMQTSSSALRTHVPVPVDAVMPGLDYGPCRICGTPLGNSPYVPYQLMAKFCAVSQSAGMGILTQLEHNACVNRLEEVDVNADAVFDIYLPPRVPYLSECSERCYILYRTACDGQLAIVKRVLAALGCDYSNVELTAAEQAGINRVRGVVADGFAKMCKPSDIGLGLDQDCDMEETPAYSVELRDDLLPPLQNATLWSSSSSAASAAPMPGEYEAPIQSSSFSFGAPSFLGYLQQ